MFHKKLLIALFLAIGLVSGALAQQPGSAANPTSPPPANQPGVTPANPGTNRQVPPFDPFGANAAAQAAPGYPGWGGDEGDPFAPPPPEVEPIPQNPVQKGYEGGKLIVIVGADRHFGYRIGHRVGLTVIVAADDGVLVDFTAIEKGVLGLNGSDFELVSPPVVRKLGKRQGKTVYRIDLSLRTFVVKPGVVFTADFLCATELTDNKTPNWKRVTTPEFVVSRSNTADNGENLLEGDLEPAPFQVSWFTYPLLLAGLSLIMLWPTLLVMEWLQRVAPRRKIPANELAWTTFDRVLAEGKSKGFTVRHYKQIAAALRSYLGVDAKTLEEVKIALKDHKDLEQILSALAKFDSALYDRGVLTDAELNQLYAELEALVPRP
jgi:hypothetical protein